MCIEQGVGNAVTVGVRCSQWPIGRRVAVEKLTKEERRRLVEMLIAEGENELALALESEKQITDPAEIKKLQQMLKKQLEDK